MKATKGEGSVLQRWEMIRRGWVSMLSQVSFFTRLHSVDVTGVLFRQVCSGSLSACSKMMAAVKLRDLGLFLVLRPGPFLSALVPRITQSKLSKGCQSRAAERKGQSMLRVPLGKFLPVRGPIDLLAPESVCASYVVVPACECHGNAQLWSSVAPPAPPKGCHYCTESRLL